MKKLFACLTGLTILCLFKGSLFAGDWSLAQSTLTYHVTHTFHKVEGTSRQAKGKGVCDEKGCEFIVGTLVKTFETGDANRDLHMQQATKAGTNPVVSVKAVTGQLPTQSGPMKADLEVTFAGATRKLSQVPFSFESLNANEFRILGQVPLLLDDFNVERPALLTIKIKNEAPIDVDLIWKKS